MGKREGWGCSSTLEHQKLKQKLMKSSFTGEWKNNVRHGKGTIRFGDGAAQVLVFENNKAVGEGAQWSPDRQTAWRIKEGKIIHLKDGSFDKITLEAAAAIAEAIGVPVPERY